MASPTSSGLGDRITSLEADQGSLVGVVEELRDAIVEDRRRSDQRFERLVETLDSRFKAVYQRLDTDRRVPWAPVGFGVTVILAAVSGWWALQSRDVSRLETRQANILESTHDRAMSHEYQRGRDDEHRARTDAEQLRSTEWMVKLGNQIYELKDVMADIRERLAKLEGHDHVGPDGR